MKISVIGAGNVGSLSAMRIAQKGLGDVVLVDVVKGLAKAKAFDLEDAKHLLKVNYNIYGSNSITEIKNSDIVVITAGLARKPGMTREELLVKNSQIINDLCSNIVNLSPSALVIVVTNPLDLMTYLALKTTGFKRERVFGMGITLDASRFANLISKELQVPVTEIKPCVIGSHGEAMLPLAELTTVKGKSLKELIPPDKMSDLVDKTVKRGAEIVSLLGNGSAFFAPSAAISELVEIIVRDQKEVTGVCAYLDGEYGIKDVCLGVPCCIGRNGIERIEEIELNDNQRNKLFSSSESIRSLLKKLTV